MTSTTPPAPWATPAPPSPPPPADPVLPASSSRRGGRIAIAALLSVALVAIGFGVGTVLHHGGKQFPAQWDPRIAPIARFDERVRGLTYDHPVRVYFLTPKQYHQASVGDDSDSPDAESKTEAAHEVAELRALGLVQGNPDLFSASKDLADSGTLAFYDQDTKVVNVRGSKFTPALRVTLAHELTHALQDQHFDLTKLLDTSDSERETAVRSVVEGDAVSVENAYEAQMSKADQRTYERESSDDSSSSKDQLKGVPDVLSTLFGLPYAIGTSFIDVVDAGSGGEPDLSHTDQLFKRMPANTSQLFTPQRYFSNPEPGKAVDPPKVFHGKQVDHDVFGAAFLFVMMSERIPGPQAMGAVDGWARDSYRAVEVGKGSNQRLCISGEIRTVSASAGSQMRTALDAWASKLPPAADPKVGGSGADVTVQTCDPGKHAAMHLTGDSSDALAYPVVRGQLAASEISEGLDRTRALCVSSKVVGQLTLAELEATDISPELEQKVITLTRDALGQC